jgi:hypothetical protein
LGKIADPRADLQMAAKKFMLVSAMNVFRHFVSLILLT